VAATASIGVHLARSGLDGHLLTDAGPVAGSAMFEDVLLDALSVVSTSRNQDFARTTAALTTIEGGLLVLVAGRLSADAAREIAAARRHGRQAIAFLLAVSTWAARPERGEHDSHGSGGHDSHGSGGQPAADGAAAGGGPGGRSTPNGRNAPDGQDAPNGRAGANGEEGPGGRSPVSKPLGAMAAAAGHAETAAAEAILRAAGWRVITVDAATPIAVAWQRLPRTGDLLVPVSEPDSGVAAI
jgi:hypothetical protein